MQPTYFSYPTGLRAPVAPIGSLRIFVFQRCANLLPLARIHVTRKVTESWFVIQRESQVAIVSLGQKINRFPRFLRVALFLPPSSSCLVLSRPHSTSPPLHSLSLFHTTIVEQATCSTNSITVYRLLHDRYFTLLYVNIERFDKRIGIVDDSIHDYSHDWPNERKQISVSTERWFHWRKLINRVLTKCVLVVHKNFINMRTVLFVVCRLFVSELYFIRTRSRAHCYYWLMKVNDEYIETEWNRITTLVA